MAAQDALEYIESNFDQSVDRLSKWLEIPSIGTDPAHQQDCVKAAQWLADQLNEIGLSSQLCKTPGQPVVMAHYPGPANYTGPHILFYGHYDVQPADPVDLWQSPPFQPTIRDSTHGGKCIVARGAVDDKGQVLTFVEALRAWKQSTGEIPCRITCLIEGEEESGSVNLNNFLTAMKNKISGNQNPAGSPCDFVLVSDTGMWDINTPAITSSLRGLVYVEITVHGPNHDLHSGAAGGCVPNPINELTRILGKLHCPETRKVNLPGFYDDVLPITTDMRKEWESLGYDERGFLKECGLTTPIGEIGYSTLERQWARPTCDINGIYGGYTGKGAKTVITTHASAKVSFRLVPNQDPAKITREFEKWVREQLPADCNLDFTDHGSGKPYVVSSDLPYTAIAQNSLEEAIGKKAVKIGTGGSIPVVESFKSILGLDTLLIGFGLEDDRVHSPNEKFELKCYKMGQRAHAVMLQRFAEM